MPKSPKPPKQPKQPKDTELEDGKPGVNMEDDEALVADRDNARTSDLTDARDGVDNSDTLPRDPDAAGGKTPR